jgi:feruloyl-CoA synthase
MAGPGLDEPFAPCRTIREARSDGALTYRSALTLSRPPATVLDWLSHWARLRPDHALIAERPEDGAADWHVLTYAQALRDASALAAGLLRRGYKAGRPLVVLAPNGIDHLRLALAAQMIGLPYAPVAPRYAADASSPDRLARVLALLAPAAIYLRDRAEAPALGRVPSGDAEILEGPGALARLRREPDAALDAARHALDPLAPAKLLMTSGSMGPPKAVILTQTTMTSNQQMLLDVWRFLRRAPPVLVDWLPWNHAFGGNHTLHVVLSLGGTLYVDDGGGRPDGLERTLRNLSDLRPTLHGAVPAGLSALLPALEADTGLRQRFAARLDAVFFAGAAMPHDTWDRLTRVLRSASGRPVPILSGWGCTEAGPSATIVHRAGVHGAGSGPDHIGTPLPGTEIKLVPTGDKLELRVRGPSVTPGYWGDAARSHAAFDAEGFYRSGDAGRFVDPREPDLGLVFDGRLGEDFKLASGTWVGVGALRQALLKVTAPHVRDVVLAGDNRDGIGALLWLDPATGGQQRPVLRAISDALARHNAAAGGASTRITRFLVLETPPDRNAGEINDKDHVSRHVVLARRPAEVARLFDPVPGPDVFEPGRAAWECS